MAEVAAPLSDCTKKRAPNEVVWTGECEQAFAKLKSQLASKPLLQSPNFEKEFILQTNASGRGLGAVLSQMGPDGQEHPVRFLSRKLLPRKQKYAAVELECLAIVWAVQALQVYLDGRKYVVETDHRALSYMQQMVNKNNRLWHSSPLPV